MNRSLIASPHLFFVIAIVTFVAIQGRSACYADSPENRGDLLILQGADGEASYGKMFGEWTERWIEAGERGTLDTKQFSPEKDGDNEKANFAETLTTLKTNADSPLWIVLIGHGTFNGRQAKFNLQGEDLADHELDELLSKFTRTTIIVNCSSASAPFLQALSQNNRIILTSTRSPEQVNFSRFGDYFSQAIGSIDADLDKDKQTSLLEAFLFASLKTLEFYESDGRIPTENALLDDNGDGKGTRAAAFQGVRATGKPEEEGVLLDGFRAHQIHLIANSFDQTLSPEQLETRNRLEKQVELLRQQKGQLEEDEYYSQLKDLFLQLAAIYKNPPVENSPNDAK